MKLKTIMTREITKLSPTDMVSDGLRLMHQHRVRSLAVVDKDDQFVGLFGIRQVLHLLLPTAAQIELGISNLSFMPDGIEELYDKLREVGDRPVSEFLEKKEDLLMCTLSTPLPKVLELLNRSLNTSLPVLVVEGDDNKLVGMVSGWDVLEKIVMNVFDDAEIDAD